MTPNQLRAALDRLGLTQVGAAKDLRCDGKTMRRWISGETRVPPTAAILLHLLLAGKVSIEDIRKVKP